MTTTQLKNIVIDKISEINDESFLKAIQKILEDSVHEKGVYRLNPAQKKTIKKSKAQLKKGEYITNEQLEKEENKWLNG